MKKCRFLLSIVILAITFNSCQKGGTSFRGAVMGNGNPQLAQIIAAKRAFYKNLSTEPGSLTTQTTGGKGFNHIKSLEKISRWDKAYSIRVSGHDIVVVPLYFKEPLSVQTNIGGNTKKDPINSLSKLIIYRDSVDNVHAEVVSGFKDLIDNPANFSGVIHVQNFNGDFIRGFLIDHNQARDLSMIAKPQTSSTITPTDNPQYNAICNYIDWYLCGTSGCTFQYTEFLGCTSISGGGNVTTITYHDYGVAVNSAQPAPDSIMNELTTACFSAVLNSMIAGGLKGELTNLIMNVFNSNDTVDLHVGEKPFLPGGTAVAAITTWGKNGNVFAAQTYLNKQALINSSKEFITETIFHEAIHAYLDYNTTVRDELGQHEQMINSYVDCELASLQELFPNLTSHDGLCLILQGFGNVQMFDSATFNAVLAHYNLAITDVNTTAGNYQSGNAGISACFN